MDHIPNQCVPAFPLPEMHSQNLCGVPLEAGKVGVLYLRRHTPSNLQGSWEVVSASREHAAPYPTRSTGRRVGDMFYPMKHISCDGTYPSIVDPLHLAMFLSSLRFLARNSSRSQVNKTMWRTARSFYPSCSVQSPEDNYGFVSASLRLPNIHH